MLMIKVRKLKSKFFNLTKVLRSFLMTYFQLLIGAEKEIQHELELMEKLNHENVVRIKGFLNMINDGMVAIVMEYVREGSLGKIFFIFIQDTA